jgi:ketosteroid isomerase-like protein
METPSDAPVRGFAKAITSGDLNAALEVCHPEVEFLSVLAVDGKAYLGHAGIRQYFEDVTSAWDEWTVEVHRTADVPDGRVVIEMTMHARGRESGLPIAVFAAHVWTLKDGKLLRNRPFREPEQALREVGQSRQARD